MVFIKSKSSKPKGKSEQNEELRGASTPMSSAKKSKDSDSKTKKQNNQKEKQPEKTKVQITTKRTSPRLAAYKKPKETSLNMKIEDIYKIPNKMKTTGKIPKKNERGKIESPNNMTKLPNYTTFITSLNNFNKNGLSKSNLQIINNENTPTNARKRKLSPPKKITPKKPKKMSEHFNDSRENDGLIDENEFREHLKSATYKRTLQMLKKDPELYRRLKNADRKPLFSFETPLPLSNDETEEIIEKYIRNRSQLKVNGYSNKCNNNNDENFVGSLTHLDESLKKKFNNPRLKHMLQEWEEVKRRLLNVNMNCHHALTADDSKENHSNVNVGMKNNKLKTKHKKNEDTKTSKKQKKDIPTSLTINETAIGVDFPECFKMPEKYSKCRPVTPKLQRFLSELPDMSTQNEKSSNGSSTSTTLETSSFRRRRLRKLYSDEEFLNSPECHTILCS